jgi:hypothetical protein
LPGLTIHTLIEIVKPLHWAKEIIAKGYKKVNMLVVMTGYLFSFEKGRK